MVSSFGWQNHTRNQTSALISGVKNFVSIGDSLVRALPVSQVKSANANGSAFPGFPAFS